MMRTVRKAALVVAALVMAGRTMAAEAVTVGFEFLDPKTQAPLVKGVERLEQDGAMVVKHTEYKALEGDKVAQTEDSRYAADSLALDFYHFEDKQTGEMADVRVKDGKAQVQYRADKDADVKTGEIDWTARSLSGKAIPELIQRHWKELLAGDTVIFDLYVPFRLETYTFRARMDGEPAAKDDGKPVTIRIEPKNWLVRQVAPSIDFVWKTEPQPRLVRYRGPSMVDIAGEKNRKVEIRFD